MRRFLDWFGLRWAGEKLFLLSIMLDSIVLGVLLIGPQGIIPLDPGTHLVLLLGTTVLFVVSFGYLLWKQRRQKARSQHGRAGERLFLLSVMLEAIVLGVLLIGPQGIIPLNPSTHLVLLLGTTVLFAISFGYLWWERRRLSAMFERLVCEHPDLADAQPEFLQAPMDQKRRMLRRLAAHAAA